MGHCCLNNSSFNFKDILHVAVIYNCVSGIEQSSRIQFINISLALSVVSNTFLKSVYLINIIVCLEFDASVTYFSGLGRSVIRPCVF